MCPETLSALKGTGAMGELTAVYIGLSVGAVVAEAILRGQDIPPDLIVRTRPLADKSLTELVLDEDVEVAVRGGRRNIVKARPGRLADGVYVGGTTRRPAEPRPTSWPARSSRGGCITSAGTDAMNSRSCWSTDEKPPTLMVVRSAPLDADGWARERVLASFLHDFRSDIGITRRRTG
ncbi:hypothetical protein R1CP_36260 (plasmid) [Rhodococcus opacus]|uniref:Uncharacterized protein n=1 Tax=Rhodococcus opacus TaxID=37919 RepID=A0A1B1KGZ6_RHOOP|nr:hypothetical protein R1CP_36260 [Rhodococcus opacus]